MCPIGVYFRKPRLIGPKAKEPFTTKRVTLTFVEGKPIKIGFRQWPRAIVERGERNRKPVEILDGLGSVVKRLGVVAEYAVDDFYFDLPGRIRDYSVRGSAGDECFITYFKFEEGQE